MPHALITLTWPDGLSATAELLGAESSERQCAVVYRGSGRMRLKEAPPASDLPLLVFCLRRMAEQTGATYSEEITEEHGCHVTH